MPSDTLARVLLGPCLDLKRFVVGSLTPPPPTRQVSAASLDAARLALTQVGCSLASCAVSNLHTAKTPLPADRAFDLFLAWQVWPLSAFFACPTVDASGTRWFAYRFYNGVPIVKMRLKSAARPHHIIYDLVWGIGAGGYHAFLFDPLAASETSVSIFTTFPPSRLFFAGLHDQMNADIYRQASRLAAPGK